MLKNKSRGRGLGWLCVCLILGLSACEWAPDEGVMGVSSQMIIGGKEDLRYPAVGVILINGFTGCSGILIASRVVLTAAHCTLTMPTNVRLGTGMSYRMDIPDTSVSSGFRSIEVGIERFFAHPNYTSYANRPLYDIGIVVLKRAVTEVTPLPLYPGTLDATWVGKKLLFMGYGMIQSLPKAIFPNRKHGALLPITKVLQDRIFGGESGLNTCHVDSGGPVLVEEKGKVYVVSVHSYAESAPVPNGGRTRCDGDSASCRVDFVRGYINKYLLIYGDQAPACVDDSHCDACDHCGASGLCERGSLAASPSQCRPCRVDGDCGGGRCARLADGFRCVQKCTSAGCCPSGYQCDRLGGSLTEEHCVPEAGRCAASTCGMSTDCGPGEACVQGRCALSTLPRSPKLCHPCWSSADCGGKENVCIGGGVEGLCGQPCGEGDICPVGFACALVSRGFLRQCVPAPGEACTIACQQSTECPKGWQCQSGRCAAPQPAAEGEGCEFAPCLDGLTCVETVARRVCQRPCGMAPGLIGAGCDADHLCPQGSVCQRSGGIRLCVGECHENSDCAAHGGGICNNRSCVCSGDKDCQSGFLCAAYGVCVPRDKFKDCPSGSICALRGKGDMRMFCSSLSAIGTRAIGQTCDAWTHCQAGSLCYFTDLDYHCIEECTKTGTCEYGGGCSIASGSRRLCGCSPGLFAGCPCRQMQLNIRQYSYCHLQNKSQPCRGGLDCPVHFVCQEGACVFKPPAEPKPEPPVELTPEPPVEVPTMPDLERARPDAAPPQDAAPSEPPQESKVADQGAPDTGQDTPAPNPGCGCATTPTQVPWGGWSLLLLLIATRPQIPTARRAISPGDPQV